MDRIRFQVDGYLEGGFPIEEEDIETKHAYKNKSLNEFLKATMNGIDRLSEITTYLVTEQYIEQLTD